MFGDYSIIDSDLHVVEPNNMWNQYLDPTFRQYAPSPDLKVADWEILHKLSGIHKEEVRQFYWKNLPAALLGGFDAELLIQALNRMGVDMGFLYPTFGLWLFAVDTMTPQLAGAFVRAYNNWLHDLCDYNPEVLKGVGAINQHAPEEMVTELHRIATFGWKAIFIRPNPIKGRLLSDPAYEPLWTECERLKIAVGIHEGTHSHSPTTGADRFNTHFALHACSHPMEQMMALLTLIEGGVLERHPNLHFGFLESGCSWLPYWLWRLDEEYKNSHWEVQDYVKLKPSDYFRRQCFVSFDPEEPGLELALNYIGSDNLLFGSDYPHTDSKLNIVEKVVALQDRFSKRTLQKLLWDNPACFHYHSK